jgi:hypothetical protein
MLRCPEFAPSSPELVRILVVENRVAGDARLDARPARDFTIYGNPRALATWLCARHRPTRGARHARRFAVFRTQRRGESVLFAKCANRLNFNERGRWAYMQGTTRGRAMRCRVCAALRHAGSQNSARAGFPISLPLRCSRSREQRSERELLDASIERLVVALTRMRSCSPVLRFEMLERDPRRTPLGS